MGGFMFTWKAHRLTLVTSMVIYLLMKLTPQYSLLSTGLPMRPTTSGSFTALRQKVFCGIS